MAVVSSKRAQGFVNFAWSAATFFVIPIIAFEGIGPRDTFNRSVSVLRQRWGEGVVGTVSISGVVMLVVLLPALVVGGLGYSMLDTAEGFGIGLIVGEYHGKEAFAKLIAERLPGWEFRVLRGGDPGTFWLLNPALYATEELRAEAQGAQRKERREPCRA